MPLTIAVTGASGFVGGLICKSLQKDPIIQCVPVSRHVQKDFYLVDDYSETPVCDVLIHLAESSDRGEVNSHGDKYLVNSARVMQSLVSKGFGKIIYISSSIVYGDKGDSPFSEQEKIEEVDVYSKNKIDNECRVLERGGVVVRLSNVIGYSMSSNNVVSDIIKQLPASGSLVLRNTAPIRDFIWGEDVAEALYQITLQQSDGIYNVGSGYGVSIERLARIALEIVGGESRQIESKIKQSDDSYNVLDITRIKDEFGWQPDITIRQALNQLIVNKGV